MGGRSHVDYIVYILYIILYSIYDTGKVFRLILFFLYNIINDGSRFFSSFLLSRRLQNSLSLRCVLIKSIDHYTNLYKLLSSFKESHPKL